VQPPSSNCTEVGSSDLLKETLVSIYQARRSRIQKDSVLDTPSRENIIYYRRISYVSYNIRGFTGKRERNRQRIQNSASLCSAEILHDDCRAQFNTDLHSGPFVLKNGQDSNVQSS
jgi:hypothetical protein